MWRSLNIDLLLFDISHLLKVSSQVSHFCGSYSALGIEFSSDPSPLTDMSLSNNFVQGQNPKVRLS